MRCLIVSDFTAGGLAPLFTVDEPSPSLAAVMAPFDQVRQVLLDGAQPCWHPASDIALVWTRPHAAIRSFGRLIDGERVALDDVLGEVDQFAGELRAAAGRVRTLIVPTWTWPSYDRGLGMLNLHPAYGPAYFLLRMNTRLIDGLATLPNVYVLDASRWIAAAGAGAEPPKLWYMGKIPFSPAVFGHAAADIKALVRAVAGRARKLVLLDLDDTLWGGIVGEVGWENLDLGGHSPVGEAFVAFQRSLKGLTRRGILLGVVSKNTESVALEAIDRHPEMVLRRADFAGWRINWHDKADNVVALVKELNLGLDSVVFIDDNPAERARVRAALPEVLTPEWPADRLLYDKALGELTCFDSPHIGEEDRARTDMYVAERQRKRLEESAQSVEDYLASLELKVVSEAIDASNIKRAAQLLNKTNQMNLSTRRMPEAEFAEWARRPAHVARVFRVADRYGDYGLTGIASFAADGSDAVVTDFLLSCRVMGRGVEQAMIGVLADLARRAGHERLVAMHRPTDRNAPCLEFFVDHSGFEREQDVFAWMLAEAYPRSPHVTVYSAGTETAPSR